MIIRKVLNYFHSYLSSIKNDNNLDVFFDPFWPQHIGIDTRVSLKVILQLLAVVKPLATIILCYI